MGLSKDQVAVIDIGDIVTGGTPGSILFVDASNNLGQDNANLFWDDSNDRLGIGTASPDGKLHILETSAGSVTVTGSQANGIIIEDDDSTALTLLDPSGGVIYFGDVADTDIGRIGYRHGGDYANSMYFTTNSTQQMTIDSSGNVGIGVVEPDSTLEVLDTTTQQKWSYDADSFATMTVADASHTTVATGESGNLTLDSAGDLTLDADSGTMTFADGGATLATIASLRQESFMLACSDETTALTTGAAKVTFRMPYAFTLTSVKASVTTAPTGADLIVDINEGGASIFTTNLLTIDDGDETSVGSGTPPNITDASLAADGEITIDIDQIGSGTAGAGLKVTLIGHQTP
jgi:hypothetical protein